MATPQQLEAQIFYAPLAVGKTEIAEVNDLSWDLCVFEVKGHQAPGIRGSLHQVSCREDFQLRWYREREAWEGVWGQDIGWCVDVVGPRAVPDLRWALHSLTFEVGSWQ